MTGLPAGYLPLFPFASHQAWHRSPDITATAFAAFVGYPGVTQVADSSVSRGDAHVAVGIKRPNGTMLARQWASSSRPAR